MDPGTILALVGAGIAGLVVLSGFAFLLYETRLVGKQRAEKKALEQKVKGWERLLDRWRRRHDEPLFPRLRKRRPMPEADD